MLTLACLRTLLHAPFYQHPQCSTHVAAYPAGAASPWGRAVIWAPAVHINPIHPIHGHVTKHAPCMLLLSCGSKAASALVGMPMHVTAASNTAGPIKVCLDALCVSVPAASRCGVLLLMLVGPGTGQHNQALTATDGLQVVGGKRIKAAAVQKQL